MRIVMRVALVWFLLGVSLAVQAQVAPEVLVRTTVNEVLGVIKQNKERPTLHDLAEKKVLPHFDFTAMTRLAVGRYWRDASEAQKKALENGFRSLLVSTYVTALSQSANAHRTVEVKPVELKPGQDDVTVRTLVREPGRQPIAIDYRMALASGGWKVYDVVVENLSLVTNYRGSFASEITRSGIDGLIRSIEEKNRKLAQG
jgi:phospholipid transport system substrate-binding protein